MSAPAGPAYIAEGLRPLAVERSRLHHLPGNPRRGVPEAIARSLSKFGQRKPVVARADGTIIAGNHTEATAELLGWDQLAVVWVDDDDTTAHAYALADNRTAELGGYDDAALAALIAEVRSADAELVAATGWSEADYEALRAQLADAAYEPSGIPLAEQFGAPPTSVLDTRQGYWRARRDQWLALGIDSTRGRRAPAGAYVSANAEGITKGPVAQKLMAVSSGISTFDPVLTELACRWWAPPGGSVLDPFAGGSVRGIVAAALGHPYHGVDLSAGQLEANKEQWAPLGAGLLAKAPAPVWTHGDSRKVIPALPAGSVDFLLACPPYADLEVYSDDPRDLSTMDYGGFLDAYAEIVAAGVRALRPERFACFVVGDIRDSNGSLRGFPAATIAAFEAAGAALYNEAVLVNNLGPSARRAGPLLIGSRKLCKTHQNVLVFYKGTDPLGTAAAFGSPAFGALVEDE